MANNALLEIKRSLEAHVGHKITLRANGGRRKTVERTGVLRNVPFCIYCQTGSGAANF